MKLSEYIGSQFGTPRGIAGRLSTFFMNHLNRMQYACVRQQVRALAPSEVLDIGFGNGYLLRQLSQDNHTARFYGIDISEDMVASASQKNRRAIEESRMSLFPGTVTTTTFSDASFDFAYTVNTVYFWDDLEAGYGEVHRILRDGGSFANVFYAKSWLDKLRYTRSGFQKYEPHELITLVQRFGFKNLKLLELKKNCAYCLIARK